MTEYIEGRKNSVFIGCGIAALIPIVLLVLAAVILVINNRPPNIKIPSHSMPKDNGWDDFKLAGEMSLKGSGPYDTDGPQNWTMAQRESLAKAKEPMLAVLRRGLAKEYMHPSVRYFDGIDYPKYGLLREVERKVQSQAIYYRKKGDFGKAADTLLDGVELGVTLPRGGVFYTYLVSLRCESIAAEDLPEVIKKLDKQELEHIAKRLEVIQKKRWPSSEVILEEGRYIAATLARMFTDSDTRNDILNPRDWAEIDYCLMDIFAVGGPSTVSGRLNIFLRKAQFAFANKATLIRQIQDYHTAMAAEQRKPYTGVSKIKIPSNCIIEMMPPLFEKGRLELCNSEAQFALLQVDVAARRFKADNGRYPDKLSQLVPKYLKSEPIDPFGKGKPIKYLPPKRERGFVVYSLGENLKDDGGVIGKSRGSASGDLVLGKGD